MLYKTYNQTIFSGYKKSLLYHSVALPHFVRILKEKKETVLSDSLLTFRTHVENVWHR